MDRLRGTCQTCGAYEMLDPHHIIPGLDPITNPNNVVYICRECHDLNPASQKRAKYEAKAWNAKPKKKAKRWQCLAYTKGSVYQCRNPARLGESYCHVHNRSR